MPEAKHVQAKDYEAHIGIDVYTTQSPGIGGRLKKTPEDFIVQEIGLDGTLAPIEALPHEVKDEPGKFLAFFLVKRNVDSIHAIRTLSKVIGVSYKRFSYAGIKDRRAITSQRVSFYRGSPQDLIGREIPDMEILHPHRVSKPVVPGALLGNRFTVIIRDINLTHGEVQRRIEQIMQEYEIIGGFLNFFGPQRFGILRPTTHLVGKQIVLGNFQEAIQILIEGEPSPEEEVDDILEDRAQGIISNQRTSGDTRTGTYERAIQHYLNKHPGDYQGSFRVLPKDLARLYIHAYQSYLFNRTISERAIRGISFQNPTIGDFTGPITGETHKVRMVTEKTLSKARKAIADGTAHIVIPIIGFDFEHVHFKGPMGEIIRSILEQEDITPNQFHQLALPTLSSRGTFRPLLVGLSNFRFHVLDATDETPVRMSFDLMKGSYASVIMREIIKPETPNQL